MKIHLLTIGKPRLAYARAGLEEYLRRLATHGGVTVEHFRSGTREQESTALLTRSAGMHRVVLDERGQMLSSRQLAAQLAQWEMERTKNLAFLIGGADGHTEALRAAADFRLALSPLTFQHELALIILLEQIYRARSIQEGAPYHRD